MLRLSLQTFFKFFTQHLLIGLILVSGLIVACFGFLFFSSFTLQEYIDHAAVNQESTRLTLGIDPQMPPHGRQQLYDYFTQEQQLFQTAQLSATSTGRVWGLFEMEPSWGAVFGRSITAQEYQDGSAVALLPIERFQSVKTQQQFDEILQEGIWVGDLPHQIIGSSRDSSVVIPLQSLLHSGIPLREMTVVFAERLTEDARQQLEQTLGEMEGITSVTMPLRNEPQASQHMLQTLSGQFFMVFFLLIIVITSFLYWIQFNMKRYRIYYLCGISNRKLAFLMISHVVYFIIFCYIISYAILLLVYRWTLPHQRIAAVPIPYVMLLGLSLLFLITIVVLWQVVRLIRRKNLLVQG